MAATLTLDQLSSAELENSYWKTTRVRSGTITNIPVSGMNDPLVLETAYLTPGMPTLGSGYPANPTWRLSTIRIVPLSGNSVRVIMYYSTTDWGTTIYLIRDSTYLTTTTTQFLPGNPGIQFSCSFNGSTPITISGGTPIPPPADNPTMQPGVQFETYTIQDQAPIASNSVSLTFMTPMRSMQITYISYGIPPTGIRPYVGFVNKDVFLGLNTGFWLFTKFEMDLAKYQGSYTVQSEILTNNIGDWSVYGNLQDWQTGRLAIPTAAAVTAVSTPPYGYGLWSGDGIIRVGPYPTTNFNSLFPAIGSAVGI
jgi:hypothetical protein